ncbi:MAG: tRNA 2-thiouridine(34) synthase MnmA, partial [Acidobacteriota bacterium]|nr:tRNA 2-thiouridine(34) synthase MnmA [Acidobacteriota bacterium]
MRIVAAMSGGVDSSVAAALLAAHGPDGGGRAVELYDQRAGPQ